MVKLGFVILRRGFWLIGDVAVKLHWASLTFSTSDDLGQLFCKMKVCSLVHGVDSRVLKATKY